MAFFNILIPRLILMAAVLGGWALLLNACGSSPPIRYYQLSSLPISDNQKDAEIGKPRTIIGVGPVDTPPYVDRLQLVTRSGPQELDVADFDRWAEPVQTGVTRVLIKNLSQLLSRERAVVVSWDGVIPSDYQVQIEVLRFDFEKSGEALLTAQWTIVGREGRDILVIRTSRFTQAGSSNEYASMVAAMSQNLESLSQEISTVLATFL